MLFPGVTFPAEQRSELSAGEIRDVIRRSFRSLGGSADAAFAHLAALNRLPGRPLAQ